MDTNTQVLAGIVGIVMPVIITFVTQAGLSKIYNMLIAIASCLLAGVITVALSGDFSDLPKAAITIFALSQAAYNLYWKNLNISGTLNEKTSIVKSDSNK